MLPAGWRPEDPPPYPASPIASPLRAAAVLREAQRVLAAAVERTTDGSLDLDSFERLIGFCVCLRLEQALDVARGLADSRCHARRPTRHDRALPRLYRAGAARRTRSRARTAAVARLMNNNSGLDRVSL
jgi:hypothetical protein